MSAVAAIFRRRFYRGRHRRGRNVAALPVPQPVSGRHQSAYGLAA